jgi:hypothetical protein
MKLIQYPKQNLHISTSRCSSTCALYDKRVALSKSDISKMEKVIKIIRNELY